MVMADVLDVKAGGTLEDYIVELSVVAMAARNVYQMSMEIN